MRATLRSGHGLQVTPGVNAKHLGGSDHLRLGELEPLAVVEPQLAPVYTDRGISDACADMDRAGILQRFADDFY